MTGKCPRTKDGNHVPTDLHAIVHGRTATVTQCCKCGEILNVFEDRKEYHEKAASK